MGTQIVFALLEAFAGDVRRSHTINQLALSSGKPYPNTHATATHLLEEGILRREIVGRGHLCSLNLSNDKTLLYLSLLQARKRDALLKRSLADRKLLPLIDSASARLGILLAWRRTDDLLIITARAPDPGLARAFPLPATAMALKAFLADEELHATVGRHTLLFGHALYATLLRRDRLEVLQ